MTRHTRNRGRGLMGLALLVALAACDTSAAVPAAKPRASTTDETPSPKAAPGVPDVNDDASTTPTGLEPGTYHVDPDGNPLTPMWVELTIPTTGWKPPLYGWRGVAKQPTDPRTLLVTITVVDNVAEDGCASDALADPPVGPGVDDFAEALASLAPFEVTSDPAEVTAFGHRGVHLELTVPEIDLDGCFEGNVFSWTDHADDGPFYGYGMAGTVEEIWLLDVDGTRVMIAAMRRPGATRDDLAELEEIVASIEIHG